MNSSSHHKNGAPHTAHTRERGEREERGERAIRGRCESTRISTNSQCIDISIYSKRTLLAMSYSGEPSWDSLVLAYQAGATEFGRAIETVLAAQRPDIWINFGHSIFRKIASPDDTISSSIPFMISLLKSYFTIVDAGTLRENLVVPKPFFPWLAEKISNIDRPIPLRGTAILVAGRIINVLPQLSKSFGVIVEAIGIELHRIATSHAAQTDPLSDRVMHPDEIIIHQVIDFLRNVKDIRNAKWISGLAGSIRDVHVISQCTRVLRPQCQVEVMQVLGKLFEISSGNTSRSNLSAEEWVVIATDIIAAVRKATVIHDAFNETLYSAIDMAAAGNFWSERTVLLCSNLCIEEIRAQPLNSVFDVKVNESLVGMLGVVFEKYSLAIPESSASASVQHNTEIVMTCIRDLQQKLVLFLSDLRQARAEKSDKKKKDKEKFDDYRQACADVRSSAISTAILITKAVPNWVEKNPALFWELCTGQLRTPLLFSHCMVESVTYDEAMIHKVVSYLRAGLAQVEKYVIKDACNLVSAISEIVTSHQYRLYMAANSASDLALDLNCAFSKTPKLPNKAKDEADNTISGWKQTCCNCLNNILQSATEVSKTQAPGAVGVLSDTFCDQFFRTSVALYITLHRACGLIGGPKGVSVLDRSRAARAEAEKTLGSSDFDAIEPVLVGLSGTILTFIDFVMTPPCGLTSWWSVGSDQWREYNGINSLSIMIIFVRYCMSSLGRSTQYEHDVELLCGDIELLSRCVGLIFHWGSLSADANLLPGEEFSILESSFCDTFSAKSVSIFGVMTDFSASLRTLMCNVSAMSHSALSDETKCVLFDVAKDALQALELNVYTVKKRFATADRTVLIDSMHAQLEAVLGKERFDHTTTKKSTDQASSSSFKLIFHSNFIELVKA